MDGNHIWHLVRLHPREDTFEVSQSRTVLSTSLDGWIREGTAEGLFAYQTRVLSLYRWLIDGKEAMAVALSNIEQHSWMGYYLRAPRGRQQFQDRGSGEMEEVSEQSLELRLSRVVGYGVHEDVDIVNWTQDPVSVVAELELDADFADQEETVRKRQQQGMLNREWRQNRDGNWELAFDYHARHEYRHQEHEGIATIHCGVNVIFERCGTPPARNGRRIGFEVNLDPGEGWHTCVKIVPHIHSEPMAPVYGCYAFLSTENEFDRARTAFLEDATVFRTAQSDTLSDVVGKALEQAKLDLAALRLHDLDHGPKAWVMAAGLPIFVALFGRDTLTAAWESQMVSHQMMEGVLLEHIRWQGTRTDPWRDEEPGKMLHEAHAGPLASLMFNPRRRYYGSATTSGFYPVVVAELWHWAGDKEMIAPMIEPALKALAWKDKYADLDGDGFYEYLSRSDQGTQNQGWKDSGDAIVYEDGSQVEPPIATCEEQAYVYVAKLELSEVLWWLGRKDEARRLYHEAGELKKRFNEKFWDEQNGFFAMGLDPQKRQIRSVASNPGHCIAAAIVDQDLVQRTADRLMSEELFTGWGVRTLSAKHPAFNPFSYHRGSVWPVEHGTFALGFLRYGLHEYLERICHGMFEAASLFDFNRLPEVFSGHRRDERHPFPALYPKANWPQAWSSSAVFSLVQSMLGLYPYAPLNVLLLDPHLPEWLPEITLSNLHVGKAVVSIRFHRERDGATGYNILDKRGTLHVLRQPSPWSLTAHFAERLADTLQSLIPGR